MGTENSVAKHLHALGGLALGLMAAGLAQAQEPALSLPEAIRQALARSPAQTVSRLEVERAAQGLQAARGARLPALDVNASAVRYSHPSLVVPIREVGVFPPLDETIYDLGVALTLPLYTGRRLAQGVVLADLGKNIAAERERLGEQELIFNTGSVYLKILHLLRLDEVYAARIASLESQAKQVQLLVKVGRAPRLDALKISVLLSKARHDRLQIENRRREAYSLLYNLMGREGPATETPLMTYTAAAAPDWTLAELQRQAGVRRAELKIAEHEIAAGAAQVRTARAERLPEVSLVGSYRERAGVDTDQFDDWNVGVLLTLPLFDGGVRRSRVEQAVIASEQARQRAEETRLAVDRQVQDAWYAHAETSSRLKVTEHSVQEAGEARAIEQLRYEQGVGLITDLLNAETSLLTAQADRLQAEFDLITARLDLLRSGGVLDLEHVLALVVAQTGAATETPRP